ncbi:MAG: two-component system, chemotaxis family, sensor kinase CheA, partial [Candidatus Hydrogenedentes bacterium]|nr:two-component system, chemotaxis family, sensor kinase CheA [Candidatus Hydrogenedentota bacterium]
ARQVLLVRGADGARMGIHLSNVIRLERLPLAGIERIGRRYAVQYRGEIMSLADTETEPVDTHGSPPYLDRILAEEGDRRKEQTDVVVCSSNNRNIGLVVDKILDVAYQPIEVQGESTRPGVSGTAVIQNLITELLDVDYFIASVAAHAGIPNEDADV